MNPQDQDLVHQSDVEELYREERQGSPLSVVYHYMVLVKRVVVLAVTQLL